MLQEDYFNSKDSDEDEIWRLKILRLELLRKPSHQKQYQL